MKIELGAVLALLVTPSACSEDNAADEHGANLKASVSGSGGEKAASASEMSGGTGGRHSEAGVGGAAGSAARPKPAQSSSAGRGGAGGKASGASAGTKASTGPSGVAGVSGAAGAGTAAAADEPAPSISTTVVSVAFGQAPAGNPTPLVLFEGGYATWDETLLAHQPIDVATSMMMKPENWVQWRRGTDRVETKSSQGWKPLPSSDEYSPSPKGTSLSAVYERVFSPNPGASPLVVLVWRYRFKSNGSFEYCYTSTIAGDPPAFSKQRKGRKGTYEVDGYTVHLNDEAGLNDVESFIYDGARPHWLWANDEPLELRKDTGQAVCD